MHLLFRHHFIGVSNQINIVIVVIFIIIDIIFIIIVLIIGIIIMVIMWLNLHERQWLVLIGARLLC